MFRFFVPKRAGGFAAFRLTILFICLAFTRTTPAQGDLDVVWETDNGSPALAYSASGKLLLAGTRLFTSDGTFLRNFVLPYSGGGPTSVALSPDQQYAAVGIHAYNQNLDLFRVADGALLVGRISAHSNGTTSVAFSPDGQLLATGGRDGTAKLWHVPDMTLIQTLNGGVGYRPRVFAVAFTRDGSLLAVGGQGGVVLYRVADGQLVRELTGAASTLSVSVSADNQFIANATNVIDQQGQCTDCMIKIWRIADGTLLRTMDAQNNAPLSIAFSADGQVIAAGSEDRVAGNGLIRFWRLLDGALLRSYNVGSGDSYVSGLVYSRNGSLIAFGSTDAHTVVARNPIPVNNFR